MVLDRIAVIVGKHVIKTSDIDLDQRLTAFLNRENVRSDSDNNHRSAERLIDQEIIRQEIISGGFRRPAESQAVAFEARLTRDRFGGSEVRLRKELSRYGLSENALRDELLAGAWVVVADGRVDREVGRVPVIVSDDDGFAGPAHLRRNGALLANAVEFKSVHLLRSVIGFGNARHLGLFLRRKRGCRSLQRRLQRDLARQMLHGIDADA